MSEVGKEPEETIDPKEQETFTWKTNPHRRWIEDRCDGNEQVMDPDSRPCCFIFYTPMLLKYFPYYMETNCVMRFLGKFGCVSEMNTRARKIIMIIALLGTIVGWGFLIYSDFAISTRYGMIDAAAYNIGSVSIFECNPTTDSNCLLEPPLAATRYSLGLKAIAFTRYSYQFSDQSETAAQIVTTFDDFCDGDQGFQLVRPEDCGKCADASSAMVASILMSTVTYFFTFTTDVLRIWRNCK